jgi:hypothetical protein
VTIPDIIANGVWVQREVTIALKKEFVRVTYPVFFPNDISVQKGGDCYAIKELVRVTSPDNIAKGVRNPERG